jgi:hypothetical protein
LSSSPVTAVRVVPRVASVSITEPFGISGPVASVTGLRKSAVELDACRLITIYPQINIEKISPEKYLTTLLIENAPFGKKYKSGNEIRLVLTGK